MNIFELSICELTRTIAFQNGKVDCCTYHGSWFIAKIVSNTFLQNSRFLAIKSCYIKLLQNFVYLIRKKVLISLFINYKVYFGQKEPFTTLWTWWIGQNYWTESRKWKDKKNLTKIQKNLCKGVWITKIAFLWGNLDIIWMFCIKPLVRAEKNGYQLPKSTNFQKCVISFGPDSSMKW